MKNTRIIRILATIMMMSNESDVKKFANDLIIEITKEMEHEAEQIDESIKFIPPQKPPQDSRLIAKLIQDNQKPERNAQKDETRIQQPKSVIAEKQSGGGTAEVRHRKAESAPESRVASEEDRGRDEVLRGDDIQPHEEGRH